jgi:hypothetical protein
MILKGVISMSFHEKNAWFCVLALLLVFIPYFVLVHQTPVASIIFLIVSVVFLAVLLGGFHLINSLVCAAKTGANGESQALDERDKIFELKATKLSAIVLGSFTITWCLNAFLQIPWQGFANMELAPAADPPLSTFSISSMDALWWVQVLFAGVVVANLAYYTSLIFQYRRAA